MLKKIIIYGHKLHSHTHSYIHNSFYVAFKNLGFETYWFDKNDKLDSFDFCNSLFLTEGQVLDNMPIREDCKYLLHFVEPEVSEALGIKKQNILNFKFFCDQAFGHKKINDFTFYDDKRNLLWLPWATNFLPQQIEKCQPKLFQKDENDVNFIGSIWDVNVDYIKEFETSCALNNKNFIWKRLVDDKEYFFYTTKSYVTVDFRGKKHLEIGYLPCRIFKSISYGVVPGTNSPHVKEAFGDYVYYNPDAGEILEGTADFWKSKNKTQIREAMDFVKTKHTYLNRVNDIMGILNEM